MTHATRRFGVAVAAALALTLALTACAGAPAPEPTAFPSASARPVTTEEAQMLAAMRFRNFDEGTRAVSATFTDRGSDVTLSGWFDFAAGVGYVAAVIGGTPDGYAVWNHTTLAIRGGDQAQPPLPAPAASEITAQWRAGTLDASGSRLNTVLALIAALGADRPENPLLLQQNGAAWLGTADDDGTPTTVFTAPAAGGATNAPAEATTRYWLDSAGLLRRFEVRLSTGSEWTTVTFGDTAKDLSLTGVLGGGK